MTSLESSAPLYSMGMPMEYLFTTNVTFQSLLLVAFPMARLGNSMPKNDSANFPMALRSTPMVSWLSRFKGSIPPSMGLITGNS